MSSNRHVQERKIILMATKLETVIERSCVGTGEGPNWDEHTQTLLFVDIEDGYVHRWSPEIGKDEKHKFDTFCTLVVPSRKGGYLVSVGNSICHLDWDTRKLTTLQTVDEGKDTRINDGKCDASGRLWFGTMALEKSPTVLEENQGTLYSLEVDGSVKEHKEGVTISNGLAWTADNKTMYYIDSIPRKVFGYDFDIKTGTMNAPCSLVVPCRKGGYLVAVGNSICHFDWDTKKLTTLQTADEGKDTRINDGKCDASGRLWFGTMGLETAPGVLEENQGTLYSLEVDGSVKKHKEGVSISNGLAWTADNKTMYYIDSIPRKVFGYDFDIKTGTMSNERVIVDFGGKETIPTLGLPDGMAIDTDGKLWVACFFAGKVFRFDPDTGKQIGKVDVPAKGTTSCCFGGKNFDEMYITCCAHDLTEEEWKETPLAGSVFRATGFGAKGTPAPIYEG